MPELDEKREEAIVESVLFTMGKSVELRQLAAALGTDTERAEAAVRRLQSRYEAEKRGMQITQLEDSWQMATRAEYYENLIRVAATPKKQILTDVVLETLSIIAYKQPITKLEIEKIRGVKSDHAVNKLIEYNLVYEVGRLDVRHCLQRRRNFCAGLESDRRKNCRNRHRDESTSSAWRRRKS